MALSYEELTNLRTQLGMDRPEPVAPEPEGSFLREMGRGGLSVLSAVPQAYAEATYDDPTQGFAVDIADQLQGAIDPNPEEYSQSLTGQVAHGLGQVGGMLGGAVIGKGVGLPQMATMMGLGATTGGVQQATDFEQTAADPDDLDTRRHAFMAGAALGTVTEALPFAGAGKVAAKAYKSPVKTVAKEAGKGVAKEGTGEAIQSLGQNYIASEYLQYDQDRQLADGMIEAAQVGGIVGGIVHGALAAVGVRVRGKEASAERDRILAERQGRSKEEEKGSASKQAAMKPLTNKQKQEIPKGQQIPMFDIDQLPQGTRTDPKSALKPTSSQTPRQPVIDEYMRQGELPLDADVSGLDGNMRRQPFPEGAQQLRLEMEGMGIDPAAQREADINAAIDNDLANLPQGQLPLDQLGLPLDGVPEVGGLPAVITEDPDVAEFRQRAQHQTDYINTAQDIKAARMSEDLRNMERLETPYEPQAQADARGTVEPEPPMLEQKPNFDIAGTQGTFGGGSPQPGRRVLEGEVLAGEVVPRQTFAGSLQRDAIEGSLSTPRRFLEAFNTTSPDVKQLDRDGLVLELQQRKLPVIGSKEKRVERVEKHDEALQKFLREDYNSLTELRGLAKDLNIPHKGKSAVEIESAVETKLENNPKLRGVPDGDVHLDNTDIDRIVNDKGTLERIVLNSEVLEQLDTDSALRLEEAVVNNTDKLFGTPEQELAAPTPAGLEGAERIDSSAINAPDYLPELKLIPDGMVEDTPKTQPEPVPNLTIEEQPHPTTVQVDPDIAAVFEVEMDAPLAYQEFMIEKDAMSREEVAGYEADFESRGMTEKDRVVGAMDISNLSANSSDMWMSDTNTVQSANKTLNKLGLIKSGNKTQKLDRIEGALIAVEKYTGTKTVKINQLPMQEIIDDSVILLGAKKTSSYNKSPDTLREKVVEKAWDIRRILAERSPDTGTAQPRTKKGIEPPVHIKEHKAAKEARAAKTTADKPTITSALPEMPKETSTPSKGKVPTTIKQWKAQEKARRAAEKAAEAAEGTSEHLIDGAVKYLDTLDPKGSYINSQGIELTSIANAKIKASLDRSFSFKELPPSKLEKAVTEEYLYSLRGLRDSELHKKGSLTPDEALNYLHSMTNELAKGDAMLRQQGKDFNTFLEKNVISVKPMKVSYKGKTDNYYVPNYFVDFFKDKGLVLEKIDSTPKVEPEVKAVKPDVVTPAEPKAAKTTEPAPMIKTNTGKDLSMAEIAKQARAELAAEKKARAEELATRTIPKRPARVRPDIKQPKDINDRKMASDMEDVIDDIYYLHPDDGFIDKQNNEMTSIPNKKMERMMKSDKILRNATRSEALTILSKRYKKLKKEYDGIKDPTDKQTFDYIRKFSDNHALVRAVVGHEDSFNNTSGVGDVQAATVSYRSQESKPFTDKKGYYVQKDLQDKLSGNYKWSFSLTPKVRRETATVEPEEVKTLDRTYQPHKSGRAGIILNHVSQSLSPLNFEAPYVNSEGHTTIVSNYDTGKGAKQNIRYKKAPKGNMESAVSGAVNEAIQAMETINNTKTKASLHLRRFKEFNETMASADVVIRHTGKPLNQFLKDNGINVVLAKLSMEGKTQTGYIPPNSVDNIVHSGITVEVVEQPLKKKQDTASILNAVPALGTIPQYETMSKQQKIAFDVVEKALQKKKFTGLRKHIVGAIMPNHIPKHIDESIFSKDQVTVAGLAGKDVIFNPVDMVRSYVDQGGDIENTMALRRFVKKTTEESYKHEVISHVALESYFGKDMSDIKKAILKDKEFTPYLDQVKNRGYAKADYADETMALIAERTDVETAPNLYRRVKYYLKRALRKFGIPKMNVTVKEAEHFLKLAHGRYMRGDSFTKQSSALQRSKAQVGKPLGTSPSPLTIEEQNELYNIATTVKVGKDAIPELYRTSRDFYNKMMSSPLATNMFTRIDPLTNMQKLPDYLNMRNVLRGVLGNNEAYNKKIVSEIQNATEEEKNAVMEFMKTDQDTVDKMHLLDGVSEGIRKAATRARTMIMKNGANLVELGILDPEIYMANINTYLPNKKAFFDNKTPFDYLKKRTELDPDYDKNVLGKINDPAFLINYGLTQMSRDASLINFFNNLSQSTNTEWLLNDNLVDFDGHTMPISIAPSRINQMEKTLLKVSDPEQRADMSKKIEQYKETLDKAQVTQQVPDPSIYKKIPDNMRYGALAGRYVHKGVYDDLTSTITELSMNPDDKAQVRKVLEKGHAAWKGSKTYMNPPHHIRSIIGAWMQMDISSPTNSVKLISDYIKTWRSALKFGDDMASSDSRGLRIAKKYGMDHGSFSSIEGLHTQDKYFRDLEYQIRKGELGNGPMSYINFAGSFAKRYAGGYHDKASDIYRLEEMVMKATKIDDYINNWEKENKGKKYDNMPEAEKIALEMQAVRKSNKAIYDYSQVPAWLDSLRKLPIGAPFLTFMYKTLNTIPEALANNPQKFIKYTAVPYIMAMMATTFGDFENEEEYSKAQDTMRKWYREKHGAYIVPWKDQHGRAQIMEFGYMVPWAPMVDSLTATGRMVQNAATGGETNYLAPAVSAGFLSGPVPSMLSLGMTGIDPFTDKPVYKDTDSPETKQWKSLMYGYNMATIPMLASTGPVGKLINKAVGDQPVDISTGLDKTTAGQDMARFLSFNVSAHDVDVNHGRNIRELRRRISELQQTKKEQIKFKAPNERAAIVKSYNIMIDGEKKKLREYIQEVNQ